MDDFDPTKETKNLAKHHISLERWQNFDPWTTYEDNRIDYGEKRYRAYDHIDELPYCFVFTVRDGLIRPISLRRAHAKEMRRYAPQKR